MKRRRRHPMKTKGGKKRRHGKINTECTHRNSRRATPNIQEVEPQHLLTENDAFLDIDNLGEDNIAYCFMTKDEINPKLDGQSKLVISFCHPGAISELQSNSPELSPEKVCLIDDRTCEGPNSKAFGVCEPLNVYEMFNKLQRKRFFIKEPSIHRRLIFITDLNSHSLSALMATVPRSHVDALIAFFHSHRTFHPHLGIFIWSSGYPTTTHSFSLPYYSWRFTRKSKLGPRHGKYRNRLRKMLDMSFLQGKTIPQGQETDYLCESQVSVLITAINSKIWTGYCFVDTYHEPIEKRKTVENYCKNGLDPDQPQMDPCVDHESENPILDPGSIF
ncbi:hypothetical protein NXS19_006381 [Fusarium pseudograminearum]|nr:hypothetical protein NXS19_006381 [Fusarium pseudograminearum]